MTKKIQDLHDSDENIEKALERASKETPFSEKTEVGEVFDNLDRDQLDNDTKMSHIDFNSRLTDLEISHCITIDELKSLGILPKNANITRQKKRLSVSKDGMGRGEKVTIASASRGAELQGRSGGMMSNFTNLFKQRE